MHLGIVTALLFVKSATSLLQLVVFFSLWVGMQVLALGSKLGLIHGFERDMHFHFPFGEQSKVGV